METPVLIAIASTLAVSLLGAVTLVWRYRRVGVGEALLLQVMGGPARVCFEGALVVPWLHRAEVLDLSARKVVVERRGRQGLSCRDGIRADVRATFLVKVERREADVLRVAREVGCERANRAEEVQALFEERFACVLASAASTFNFDELVADRNLYIDHVMMEVGTDLLGFRLERVSLGRLEQTPLDQLDPTNVLDAQGILTLTERATRLALETNEQMRHQQLREQHQRQESQARQVAEALDKLTGQEDELEREVVRALERSRSN
ncbi:SPFH domain-containing protein [Archangium sp.]|uniref:SPFH domain-containing protein n=1 Tax=Archangium sp. TaxID=1872627 RepID=UPI002ED98295